MKPDRVLYWSRKVGRFVNKETGEMMNIAAFSGSVRQWYSTLTDLVKETADEIDEPGLTTVVTVPDESFVIFAAAQSDCEVLVDSKGICSIGKYSVIPGLESEEDFREAVFIFNQKKSVAVKILDMIPF